VGELYVFCLLLIAIRYLKFYMVMSRDQNAGRSHNMKIDNSYFERVEEFKYLGTTLTNQNSVQEEIKSRLKAGNACYHSVQNFCLPVCYQRI
jgi:hypothetical protein